MFTSNQTTTPPWFGSANQRSHSQVNKEKHCATCTCGLAIRPNSFYIKQNINLPTNSSQTDKESVRSILKLLGHSENSIDDALSVNSEIESRSSSQKNVQQRPSIESIIEESNCKTPDVQVVSQSNVFFNNEQEYYPEIQVNTTMFAYVSTFSDINLKPEAQQQFESNMSPTSTGCCWYKQGFCMKQ